MCVSRIKTKEKRKRSSEKGRLGCARRCQGEEEGEELVQKSRRVGPVTQLCTRGPLPLSARGGLISRPYRIRHDNRPNIHTNAVPEAPTVQRGPPMREAVGVLAMSKRSFSVLFLLFLALLPVCCFLPLTSRVLKLCWVLTVSRETNALPFQNKSRRCNFNKTFSIPIVLDFVDFFALKYKPHSRVFNNHSNHAQLFVSLLKTTVFNIFFSFY